MFSRLANFFKSTPSYQGLGGINDDDHPLIIWGKWRRGEWIVLTVLYWIAFTVFLFSLPWLSDTYNQKFWNRAGWLGPLCHTSVFTPGLECKNGQDLIDIATRHNRTWICGCGQGLFGESLCPVVPGGFSVSFFIGSSTATGIFTFLSFWPMLSLWWYHDWLDRFAKPPPDLVWDAWLALCGVQVLYGVLCFTQVCFFPKAHVFFWALFLFFWFCHIITIAYICYLNPNLKKALHVIVTTVMIVVVANTGMVFSSHVDCERSMHICTYGYWFFECIQLSAISGMSCFLVVLANVKAPVLAHEHAG